MKRKSIYIQLFALIMTLFLVSFLVAGALLFSYLGTYLSERHQKELDNIAHQVIDMTVNMADINRRIPADAFLLNINAIAQSTGTEIIVVDATGDLVVTSIESFEGPVKREFVQDVIEGREADYRGKVEGLHNEMLTVARPMFYEERVVGGVLVTIPMPEITRFRVEMVKVFAIIVGIVAVVAAVAAYVLSRRITKPLSELTAAARSIANGDFSQRVSVKANNELGELSDTFNHMADSIEQLERMRSSFIANVSHDLRTPMTTIIGFVEGIMDGTIPEEKHEWYLSIVLDEGRRLSRIVTDLLDISKLEQGSFTIEKREFDLNELLRLHVIKFEKRITEKNIQLSVEFESEYLRVFADKDAVQRVITNLFDNAIKFTPEGGFIDISTGTKEGKAFFSVQNAGLGIEKKDLLHIFDRFYKSDKSRGLDKNGAGLGLFIVKSIIQAHGETVWAESEPGEYTRFSFTLERVNEKPEKRKFEE